MLVYNSLSLSLTQRKESEDEDVKWLPNLLRTFFTTSKRIKSALHVRLQPREAKNGQILSSAEPKSLAVLRESYDKLCVLCAKKVNVLLKY